jgi:hypothetical protein
MLNEHVTEQYSCHVCGYSMLDEPPYDKYGCATYTICPCCGTEFGYDDSLTEHLTAPAMDRQRNALVGRLKWAAAGLGSDRAAQRGENDAVNSCLVAATV